jgi:TolB-like protein/Flp pilus assembly protein TadD
MAVVALYSIWTTKETAEVSTPTGKSLLLTRLSELPSVAVLYLENLSGSSDEDFFAAGMTEDIIMDLSNIRGLRVLSRQDVVQYRGKQTNIKTIGEALNVDYVMEGSVRRAGDKLRVTAQLIKAADGFHVWAERFDRDMQDVFAVQAEIARSIAEALAVKLTPREKQVVERVPTSMIAAYDLYLKGHQLWDERSKEDNAEAETLFRRAIALDENYALAYIGLAENFLQRVDWRFDDDPKWIAEAKILLDRAAAIDSTPAELYVGLQTYYRLTHNSSLAVAAGRRAVAIRPYDYFTYYNLAIRLFDTNQWEEAEDEFRIALELKPNYAEPYRWLARMATNSGKPQEAERHILKAVELAPDAAHILNAAQWWYFHFGDFEKSKWYASEAIRLKPKTPNYVRDLGVIELFERNLTQAIAHLKTGAEGAKPAYVYYYLGWAYRLSGDHLRADETFRNLLRQVTAKLQTDSTDIWNKYWLLMAKAALGEVTDPVQQLKQLYEEVSNQNLEDQISGWLMTAGIYAIVGDYDRALEYVRMVLDSRAYSEKYIAAYPAFESLKSDSRFQAMLEKYE